MDYKIKNKTSNKSFGFFFGVIFLLVFYFKFFSLELFNYLFLFSSLIFFFCSLFKPKLLSPLNDMWFKIGLFLGKFISPLVLGLIFFVVVLPTGIIMRILGKNTLNLKKSQKDTYWICKKDYINDMKDQF